MVGTKSQCHQQCLKECVTLFPRTGFPFRNVAAHFLRREVVAKCYLLSVPLMCVYQFISSI